MNNLDSYWRTLAYQGKSQEHARFIMAAQTVVPEIRSMVAQGQVWQAYDLWQDFYDEFENEFGMPLFVMMGTVLVETKSASGPKRRERKLMKTGGPPPSVQYQSETPTIYAMREEHEIMAAIEDIMRAAWEEGKRAGVEITQERFDETLEAVGEELSKQFEGRPKDLETIREFYGRLREGVLKMLFGGSLGYSLGALHTWLVQYADFGGARHAGRHTNEERAKYQAQDYLETLLHHLRSHVFAMKAVGRHPKYVEAGLETIDHVSRLLEQEKVWKAYLTYKDFERNFRRQVGEFPLEMSIGTMRVVPEPVPES